MNKIDNIHEKKRTRDLSIDAARGVALFMVAISHAHNTSHYLTDFYIMAFFFLSGWLYKPGQSYLDNIKKKAKRVLVPYFVNNMILLLICIVGMSLIGENIIAAVKGVLYSRYYMVPDTKPIMGDIANSPLWFLTSFFTASLLFHLVVDRFTDSTKKVVLLFLILITGSICLSQVSFLLPWSLDMAPFFTVVMVCGYLFKKQKVDMDFSWPTTIVLLAGYVVLSFENGSINLSIRQFWGRLSENSDVAIKRFYL